MSVIIRLQNLPWSASAMDIRQFFQGLTIPQGGVHIIGGDKGDAFIAFGSDEDARKAMMKNMAPIIGTPVQLFLSSKSEMHSVVEEARKAETSAATQAVQKQGSNTQQGTMPQNSAQQGTMPQGTAMGIQGQQGFSAAHGMNQQPYMQQPNLQQTSDTQGQNFMGQSQPHVQNQMYNQFQGHLQRPYTAGQHGRESEGNQGVGQPLMQGDDKQPDQFSNRNPSNTDSNNFQNQAYTWGYGLDASGNTNYNQFQNVDYMQDYSQRDPGGDQQYSGGVHSQGQMSGQYYGNYEQSTLQPQHHYHGQNNQTVSKPGSFGQESMQQGFDNSGQFYRSGQSGRQERGNTAPYPQMSKQGFEAPPNSQAQGFPGGRSGQWSPTKGRPQGNNDVDGFASMGNVSSGAGAKQGILPTPDMPPQKQQENKDEPSYHMHQGPWSEYGEENSRSNTYGERDFGSGRNRYEASFSQHEHGDHGGAGRGPDSRRGRGGGGMNAGGPRGRSMPYNERSMDRGPNERNEQRGFERGGHHRSRDSDFGGRRDRDPDGRQSNRDQDKSSLGRRFMDGQYPGEHGPNHRPSGDREPRGKPLLGRDPDAVGDRQRREKSWEDRSVKGDSDGRPVEREANRMPFGRDQKMHQEGRNHERNSYGRPRGQVEGGRDDRKFEGDFDHKKRFGHDRRHGGMHGSQEDPSNSGFPYNEEYPMDIEEAEWGGPHGRGHPGGGDFGGRDGDRRGRGRRGAFSGRYGPRMRGGPHRGRGRGMGPPFPPFSETDEDYYPEEFFPGGDGQMSSFGRENDFRQASGSGRGRNFDGFGGRDMRRGRGWFDHDEDQGMARDRRHQEGKDNLARQMHMEIKSSGKGLLGDAPAGLLPTPFMKDEGPWPLQHHDDSLQRERELQFQNDRRANAERGRHAGQDKDRDRSPHTRGTDTAKPSADVRKETISDSKYMLAKGFPPSYTYKEICQFFSGCEIPLDGVKLIKNAEGQSTGGAFLKFANADQAKLAFKKNGEKVLDKTVTLNIISCKEFETENAGKKIDSGPSTAKSDSKTGWIVVVKGLPFDTKQEDVSNFFSSVKLAKSDNALCMEQDSSKQTCMAYMDVASSQDFNTALSFNGRKLGSAALELSAGRREDMEACLKRQQRNTLSEAGSEDKPSSSSRGVLGPRPPLIDRPPARSIPGPVPLMSVMTSLRGPPHAPRNGPAFDVPGFYPPGGEPPPNHDPSYCVHIQGLPMLATFNDIRDFFSDSNIVGHGGIHIVHDGMGKPMGEGFVEFPCPEDKERALKKDKTSMGRHIVAVKSVAKSDMIGRLRQASAIGMHPGQMPFPDPPGPPFMDEDAFDDGMGPFPPDMLNPDWFYLSCENLPPRVCVGEILEFFEPFHPIGESVLLHCAPDGSPTGMAVVGFRRKQDAANALLERQRNMFRNCRVFLVPAN